MKMHDNYVLTYVTVKYLLLYILFDFTIFNNIFVKGQSLKPMYYMSSLIFYKVW